MFEYHYRKPFYLRRWFQALVLLGFVLAIAGGITAFVMLRPLYLKAHDNEVADLKDIDKVEQASIIYDRKGREIDRIFVENRDPVPLDRVPSHLIDALVATEDARYFEHDGVDYMGIIRASIRNLRAGEIKQGASTITQQLARNAYNMRERTWKRKATEVFLAHRIEDNFSKGQILEMYLNRIYFGSGFYGVSAAARGYFGKDVSELTIEESATLVGLIKSPQRYSPFNNPEGSEAVRNYVFQRMQKERMLTRKEANALKEKPLIVQTRRKERKQAFEYAYARIREFVVDKVGSSRASSGGYHIYTTIDSDLQLAAFESLTSNMNRIEQHPSYSGPLAADFEKELQAWMDRSTPEELANGTNQPAPHYVQGAFIVLDNKTGAIRALAGGRDWEHSRLDRTEPRARFKTGTAFKPFVYATGFSEGRYPGTRVDDSPIDNRYVMIGGTSGILAEWGSESPDNSYEGWISARRALYRSKDAATVRFGLSVGLENVVKLAENAGLQFLTEMRDFPATFLGNSEASISEMAMAYTIFPNGGSRPNSTYIVKEIRDSDGNIEFRQESEEPFDVTDPYSTWQVHSALREVMTQGPGREAHEKYELGDVPAVGMPGTAYGFTNNWMVGYTSELTCAVWAGFDRPNVIYHGAFASDTVLPVWTDAMTAGAKAFEPTRISPPEDSLQVELCNVSGDLAKPYCYHLEDVDGHKHEVRDTYLEYINPNYQLNRLCAVCKPGGDKDKRLLQPILGGVQIASISGYASSIPAVPMRAPTVVGEDPYDSIVPVIRARILEIEEEDQELVEPEAEGDTMPEGEGPLRPIIIGSNSQGTVEQMPGPPANDGPAPIFQDQDVRGQVPDAESLRTQDAYPPLSPPRPRVPRPSIPSYPGIPNIPNRYQPPQQSQADVPPRAIPIPQNQQRTVRPTDSGIPSVLNETPPDDVPIPRARRIQFD